MFDYDRCMLINAPMVLCLTRELEPTPGETLELDGDRLEVRQVWRGGDIDEWAVLVVSR